MSINTSQRQSTIHIRMCMRTHTNRHTQTHACAHAHTYTQTCAHPCTHTHTYARTHMQTHMHPCTHARAQHTYAPINAHVHSHACTQKLTHTHTQGILYSQKKVITKETSIQEKRSCFKTLKTGFQMRQGKKSVIKSKITEITSQE